MTTAEIESGIKATIDQYYSFPITGYIKENQLQFIGGVLQTALHLLPNDRYFALKQYIYDRYGYDPGGVTSGQVSLSDMVF